MKKVLILTDYGDIVGNGHISRCEAIASELNTKIIASKNAKDSWHKKEVENQDFCGVLVDSYFLSQKKAVELQKKFKKLFLINDFSNPNPLATLIINPNIYGKTFGNFVGGSAFVPIRKELLPFKKNQDFSLHKTLLITLGTGVKEETYLKLAKILKNKFKKIVCLTKGKSSKNISFVSKLSPKEIGKLFSKVSLAISSGGVTANELCFFGVPFIGIKTAQNQELNLKEYKARGIIKKIFALNSQDLENKINQEISWLILDQNSKKISLKQQILIGKNGAKNIAKAIKEKL